ncbi:MAG: malto-oligosyltrehalose trehalohydrolase [Corynebacterium sp.]|nr:malto-oligosyltrehalose trehalohydrolase [Corynebacterium sp.]
MPVNTSSAPSLPTYSVWAPHAHDMQVEVNGVIHLLSRDTSRRGWWVSDVPMVDGDRYGFRLDYGNGEGFTDTVPDPRTRRQPDGVLGLSQVYTDTFEWSDAGWTGRILPGMVIYELHVGAFTPEGTFAGVETKLDYLADLGVTAIELMPVQPCYGDFNWGYDGVDWHCVTELYGGPDGLKHLVNAAHATGIAVILDVVYNHFGPDGNYTGMFGPYMTSGATDWGDVINYAGRGSHEVRAYVRDAAAGWLREFHIDGLRLDAIQTIVDPSPTSIVEEIVHVAATVEAETGIPRTIIGETDADDPRLTLPRPYGVGLDAVWHDDLHHALHTSVSGEQHAYYSDFHGVKELFTTITSGFFYQGGYSGFRDRNVGGHLDLATTPAYRLVSYTTDHDQTGNRPRGDRPSMNLTEQQLALKWAVLATNPMTPMIFMGEEFGALTPFPFFAQHSSPDLDAATCEGRARSFSYQGLSTEGMPVPADPATFASARLDWAFTTENGRLREHYERMLELRGKLGFNHPWLSELTADMVDDAVVWYGHATGIIVCNFSDTERTAPIGGELVYSFGDPVTVTVHSTVLGPWGFAVLIPAGP